MSGAIIVLTPLIKCYIMMRFIKLLLTTYCRVSESLLMGRNGNVNENEKYTKSIDLSPYWETNSSQLSK